MRRVLKYTRRSCVKYSSSSILNLQNRISQLSFSTETRPLPEAETEAEDLPFHFLDPNNPPELTDDQVAMLSEDGWNRVKAVYPKDFKTMMDKVAIDGIPDYSQLGDLSKAFSPDEPVPYHVEVDERQSKTNKSEQNSCILCAHYQRKMCGDLDSIEYTNVNLLNKFVNERGMINSRRVNGTCGKSQRHLAWLIRRARQTGLISYLEKWQPSVSFMEQIGWNKADVESDPREFYSKRKGKKV